MLTGYKVGCTIDGKNPQTGNTCQMCGGTHLAGHKSEQDVVKFPMPLHQDDIMKLSDLVFSEKPDLETLKYYREQVEVRRNNVYRTIFSGNQQTRPTGPSIDGGNVTATEAIYNRDGENNTLLSIADARSLKYRQLAGYIARLMFIQGTVKFIYEYPRDLKLASLAELYADLMAARAANVPDFELEQICDDMARKRYEADPDSLRKYFVKKQHVPYIALSIGAFQYYDSVGLIPKRMAVLIANQDIVFGELEEEDDGFYKLPFVERDKRVTAKVATIESQLPVAPPEIGG